MLPSTTLLSRFRWSKRNKRRSIGSPLLHCRKHEHDPEWRKEFQPYHERVSIEIIVVGLVDKLQRI